MLLAELTEFGLLFEHLTAQDLITPVEVTKLVIEKMSHIFYINLKHILVWHQSQSMPTCYSFRFTRHYLFSLRSQLLLLDFKHVTDVVGVSGSLTPELSSHLCLHHFPQLRQLHTDTHSSCHTDSNRRHILIFCGIKGRSLPFTFLSCSKRASSVTCCKAVLTVLLMVLWCSSFCCSSAASMWICSVTLCSASSRFSWSMRRCAWAIRAFRSSSDSLPANRQNNVQHHHEKKEHNRVPIQ